VADDTFKLIETSARANGSDAIITTNHARIGRNVCLLSATDARNSHARLPAPGNRIEANTVEVAIRYDEGASFDWLCFPLVLHSKVDRFLYWIDAEDLLQQHQRSDHPCDGSGISDGVSQRRQCQTIRSDVGRHRKCLRRSTERWRVRYRAAQNAQHHSRIEMREPADDWRCNRAEDDDRGRN
jgi:hypothetical protein